jgi:stearoyl-CoA desaturase (delta-9 desaturase)
LIDSMRDLLNRIRDGLVVSIPFFGIHAAAVYGVIHLGWTWKGFAIFLGTYLVRMFGMSAGYHRYFAHRTYRTSRVFQFLLALLAQTTVQKGALWWAAHHRAHHSLSDTPEDLHSMKHHGFWYAHVGWVITRKTEGTRWEWIPDLKRFPELVFLNENQYWVSGLYAVATLVIGGWTGFIWGFCLSTVVVWHATFFVNSLAHRIGGRRYDTGDESRNSVILTLLTLGEGWHNNHHFYPRSCRSGFFWWELDPTYYVLRALSWVGIVWDLQVPSEEVKRGKLPPSVTRARAHAAKRQTG